MALQKAMVSSKSNEWATPLSLFEHLNKIFKFTLDPCSTHENAKCQKHYTLEDNGLSKSWKDEIVWINPPYGGHVREWLEKGLKESQNNATCVFLIVSATDRSYWHDIICKDADEVWFLRGRVKFGGQKTTAPFASAIVIFRPNSKNRIIKFVDLREFAQ